MRRFRLLVAHLLLGVMLATLLSPAFGWEHAGASDAPDVAAAASAGDRGGAGDRHAGGAHPHHGCVGHMLGHLQAQLASDLRILVVAGAAERPREPADGLVLLFSSRLDRPPLAPSFA